MSFAWHREVAHLGAAKQKWLHQCEWVLYRGWKKKGQGRNDLQGQMLARFKDPSHARDLFYNLTWLSSGHKSDH